MKTHQFTLLMAVLLASGVCFTSCCVPKSLVAGGGCGFTNFSGSDGESWDTGSRLDLFSALVWDCEDLEPVQFRTVLSYEKRGADFEDTFMDGSMSYTFSEKLRLNYIYVAPEFSTDIIADRLEFVAAPQVGFLIDATSDQESSLGGGQKEDVTEFYETVDFGIRGGLRVNITDRFEAGVNYYQGLKNVQSDFEAKNNGFGFRLGYNILDF